MHNSSLQQVFVKRLGKLDDLVREGGRNNKDGWGYSPKPDNARVPPPPCHPRRPRFFLRSPRSLGSAAPPLSFPPSGDGDFELAPLLLLPKLSAEIFLELAHEKLPGDPAQDQAFLLRT